MELRSIVLCLSQKGLSAKDIHLGMDYSTMTLYLRDARCVCAMGPEIALDHNHEPDNPNLAILAALSEHPFASVQESSR
jgi:hypothetical protein